MSKTFVFLLMIFFHIMDDYRLQGILASMKQREWWKKNGGDHEMYKLDYVWALIMHSFSWTFMIMLPIAIKNGFNVDEVFVVLFIINVLLHAVIDDLKANKKQINLWQDQIAHMIQILATFIALI